MRLLFAASLMAITLAAFGCASQTVDDTAITTSVKSKLAANTDTSAIKIHVDTVNGVVTLSGTVPTATEKSRAEEIARKTDGVTRVVNNIAVDPNAVGATNAGEKAGEAARSASDSLSDATILSKIKTQLVAEGVIGTNVDVTDGNVVIRGEVENGAEKDKAEAIAKKTDGVKSVKNLLTIKK